MQNSATKGKKLNKGVVSWVLYDCGNSAFSTTLLVGFFPIFFKKYWGASLEYTTSTFLLGLGNGLAALLVFLVNPVFGVLADRRGLRKRILAISAFVGILATVSFSYIGEGHWQWAFVFLILGVFAHSLSFSFYDSLIMGVSTPKTVDFVSSLGYSAGYLGGGVLFAVNVLMYLKPHWFGVSDSITSVKIAFFTVGVWWLLFTIPLLRYVREPGFKKKEKERFAGREAWRQLLRAYRDVISHKKAAVFLVAYWLYIDAVYTVMQMAVDFGIALNFPAESLIVALLVTQFVGFPAVLLYVKFSAKVGLIPSLFVAIGAYCVATSFGVFMNSVWQFYLLAAFVGLFQGGILSLSRSLYARLIPANKSATFFSFFNIVSQSAAILGPFLLGVMVLVTGSNRFGVLMIPILLATGGFFLLRLRRLLQGEHNVEEQQFVVEETEEFV